MKRFMIGLMVAAVAAIGFGSPASAAATTLQTFGTGVTILTPDSASIALTDGLQSGGVFINSKSLSGKPLSEVVVSFVSTGDVAGGAPRFSIPIDTDGVGSTNNGYAFLDALGCNSLATSGTMVTVSTALENCHVNFAFVDYANWRAFAAANPTYRIGPGFIPFIIADGTAGTYKVSSIDLR